MTLLHTPLEVGNTMHSTNAQVRASAVRLYAVSSWFIRYEGSYAIVDGKKTKHSRLSCSDCRKQQDVRVAALDCILAQREDACQPSSACFTQFRKHTAQFSSEGLRAPWEACALERLCAVQLPAGPSSRFCRPYVDVLCKHLSPLHVAETVRSSFREGLRSSPTALLHLV